MTLELTGIIGHPPSCVGAFVLAYIPTVSAEAETSEAAGYLDREYRKRRRKQEEEEVLVLLTLMS